ncbi:MULTISPECIES: hypothetical protein [unclassified Staphylococcus]|uniref:hypothetical protein n=1 Tax=unclassified Staphylococcus TaxID=91994 RepID=UPI0021D311FC|nr:MULTISPECIES: hypothetical protein [unclassified Staphylococcus]UXR78222.1 hypothetical protein MUA92_10390 [Staphylococcus sp. IVB6227]UXR82386.1 hypothetical protein MUA51_10110 [Staphylococcus sp. IVB6214]
MNRRKVYLILLIVTFILFKLVLPEITGNYNFITRLFGVIPFVFFILFICSRDKKEK